MKNHPNSVGTFEDGILVYHLFAVGLEWVMRLRTLTQFISHPALRDENLKGSTVTARAYCMEVNLIDAAAYELIISDHQQSVAPAPSRKKGTFYILHVKQKLNVFLTYKLQYVMV